MVLAKNLYKAQWDSSQISIGEILTADNKFVSFFIQKKFFVKIFFLILISGKPTKRIFNSNSFFLFVEVFTFEFIYMRKIFSKLLESVQ